MYCKMNFERRCKLLTEKEIDLKISDLLKGCGKEMSSGDCWHYRPNGNKPAYCSNCTRKLKILEKQKRTQKV